MRKLGVALGAVPALNVAAPEVTQAKPGGCLKYGVGGAIAGHFAGGHRWTGAALGCALGIYQRRRYESQAQSQERLRREQMERRRLDGDLMARRPRRGFAPDDTGGVRARRERDTIY